MTSKYSDFRKVAKPQISSHPLSRESELNEINKMLESFNIPPNDFEFGIKKPTFIVSYPNVEADKSSEMGETCDITTNVDSEFSGNGDVPTGKMPVVKGQHRRHHTECEIEEEKVFYHEYLGDGEGFFCDNDKLQNEGMKNEEEEYGKIKERLLQKLHDLGEKLLEKNITLHTSNKIISELDKLEKFLDKN